MAGAKTSESHPLIINGVPIPDSGGAIGLTLCPGKKHQGAYSGTWNRDLALDLQSVVKFGAKALVTLMEQDELSQVKVQHTQLAKQARHLGLEWHHLPIVDVSVPDERFEDLWTYSGTRLRTILARGDNIVIHCLGGLGRTGTVAAKLLVEFGEQPEIAIQRVRQARPGSIETVQQEQYVRRCKPIPTARIRRTREERALACILGGALGDALGYEVEFQSLAAIQERFGDAGIRAPVLHDGNLLVSDDTQMTLFTLEGVVRVLSDHKEWIDYCIPAIRDAYLDWYRTQTAKMKSSSKAGSGWLLRQPVMHVRRAPGNTCLSALAAGGKGAPKKPINDSKGCGGVMRAAPLGLIPAAGLGTTFRLGAEAAALTHGHSSGYLSAGMMAALVRGLLDATSLIRKRGTFSDRSAIDHACSILAEYPGHEETLRVIEKAVELAATIPENHIEAIEKLGSGWVGEEALAIGLYAALSGTSSVEAICIAANHSGDSDSTASIAGQLWGDQRDRRITGIVTASDLSLQFQALAEPFLLLREIELHVRQLLGQKICEEDFSLLDGNPQGFQKPQNVADLSFGQYVRLFQHPKIWAKLDLKIDAVVLTRLLEEVRVIRNDVMHFDPDPMTFDELGTLKRAVRFMQELYELLP